ncbi:IS3 family transposase [Nocardia seriolae]|uniref:IS3 family transposase n=1 Tax=Nocardia seriolae TaxID=37332 RepID=UPI00295301CA|nr:IS3 family transposase [Nocardia seriolae]BEK91123.1 hypothetical protein NSERKGN1266_70740 [Nocardia seriolae]
MSVAGFIAAQRTEHGVPHAVSCLALEVSESWFYKWNDREPTQRQQRREELTAAIGKEFADSGRTYGSPRIGLELREKGWQVSENTIAAIMAENAWVARKVKRRSATTRQGNARRHRIWCAVSSPLSPRTCCGSAMSPRSSPTRGNCIWRRWRTGSRVGCSATPPVPIMMPNWLVLH